MAVNDICSSYPYRSQPKFMKWTSKTPNVFADSSPKSADFGKTSISRHYPEDLLAYRLSSTSVPEYKLYRSAGTKKTAQISSPSTASKYSPSSYRTSSSTLSLPPNTFHSRTVDSKTLSADGNANYRSGIDSSFRTPDRKLGTLSRSELGSRKYLTDSLTNGYNGNDVTSRKDSDDKKDYISSTYRKDIDDKKDYLSGTYRKRYDSESSDESSCKWAGLRNLGNTCFMNSILQCLSCTKLLKEYLMSRSYVKDISDDGKLINAFGSLITKIWSQSSGAVDVSAFKEVFQRLAPQFANYDQHDAQEFLRFLIDKLHTEVNRVYTKPRNLPELDDDLPDSMLASEHWKRYLLYENSYILDLFCGQLKSTLECLVCGNKSVTFEIFWDVSLPLPASYSSYSSSISIKDILENFTQAEILDNREKPRCSRCKIEQRMAKSYSFQKLPKYLVLHLKRFETTSSYRKLSTVVQFPLVDLDMSPYLAKAAVNTPKRYNLYAVSNHSGTPFNGHYTANCKHPNCADWYKCDDLSVSKVASPVSPKIVNSESYILFYEAVDD